MRRREFMALLAGAAVARPVVVRAQARPVLGFMASGEPTSFATSISGFAAGLKEAGFIDGQNLTIDYRWAEGRFDRLPGIAAELVRRPVDVLFAAQGTVSALAAKRATSTIPVVFVTADDPIAAGLVASMNRPGGNLTGLSRLGTMLVGKSVELMHQLLPAVSVIGLLQNPKRPTVGTQRKNAEEAAAAVGKTIRMLPGGTEAEIDAAFKTIASERIGALVVPFDSVFNIHRKKILALAAEHRVPAVYAIREFIADGGLMSYGDDPTESYRQGGIIAGRILKGATPGELPVQQSTKLQLALNLKTAKSLGLTVPLTILGRADEVIE